jgi:hypothetical protein
MTTFAVVGDADLIDHSCPVAKSGIGGFDDSVRATTGESKAVSASTKGNFFWMNGTDCSR